jgi:hypothetical protein
MSIKIPESVKIIGNGTFWNCTFLTSIEILDNIKSIGDDAFYNCRSLKNIEIPESVKIIGTWAFYNCPSLEEIIFKGKTINQVKAMDHYPWGIENDSIIR